MVFSKTLSVNYYIIPHIYFLIYVAIYNDTLCEAFDPETIVSQFGRYLQLRNYMYRFIELEQVYLIDSPYNAREL